MNYSKPLWQIERDLVKGVRNAFIQADNGQHCASMFDELDKSNPDIHEYEKLPLILPSNNNRQEPLRIVV